MTKLYYIKPELTGVKDFKFSHKITNKSDMLESQVNIGQSINNGDSLQLKSFDDMVIASIKSNRVKEFTIDLERKDLISLRDFINKHLDTWI